MDTVLIMVLIGTILNDGNKILSKTELSLKDPRYEQKTNTSKIKKQNHKEFNLIDMAFTETSFSAVLQKK